MKLSKVAFAFVAGVLALAAVTQARAADATLDDGARILAGLPPAADSPLMEITKDRVWQQHADYLNRSFGDLDKRQMSRIQAWSGQYVKTPRQTLYYFFSGPDILYANSFFPKYSTYLMAGLEQPGPVPEVHKLSKQQLYSGLRNISVTLSPMISNTFFRTLDMGHQLSLPPLPGTTPIIMVFLARSGKVVKEASLVHVTDDGTLQNGEGPRTLPRGVKIVFSDKDGPNQTLYYFSTNLADDGTSRSGFLKWAATLGKGEGMVKSASYLLHGNNFSRVRNFLLENANTIVQDDTGIPALIYDKAGWRIQPFGVYHHPGEPFVGMGQGRLSQIYQQVKPIPIDFGVGYRSRGGASNLVIATKGDGPTPVAAPPAAAPQAAPQQRRQRAPRKTQ